MKPVVEYSNGMVEFDNGWVDKTRHQDDMFCACYQCRKNKPYSLKVAKQPKFKAITYYEEEELLTRLEIEYELYTLQKYTNKKNKTFYYEYERIK